MSANLISFSPNVLSSSEVNEDVCVNEFQKKENLSFDRLFGNASEC